MIAALLVAVMALVLALVCDGPVLIVAMLLVVLDVWILTDHGNRTLLRLAARWVARRAGDHSGAD